MKITGILMAVLGIMIGLPAHAQSIAFDLPAPNLNGLTASKLWSTYYHIWQTRESDSGLPLLDNQNNTLTGLIAPRDWCMGAIEGTVIYTALDGTTKTYNYVDHKGNNQIDCAKILAINPLKKPWIKAVGRSRYRQARGQYGDGVKSYKLVPYRTIAVDKSNIPYGSLVYIPQARGKNVELPSGETVIHDGYFFAGDTGGAIKGNHIDVFSGVYRKNPFPNFIFSKSGLTFDAFIINDAEISKKIAELHQ